MDGVRVVTDLAECRGVWQQVIPPETIYDLWEVRACFQRRFQRAPLFLVSENARGIAGFLPLSWTEEAQCYGCFPGETWSAKTWLEQNRILCDSPHTLDAMLAHCPGHYDLRYLHPIDPAPAEHYGVDEIGYLFLPPRYDYDIERYFDEFSHKSAKRIRRELADIEALGVTYRYDDPADFEALVALNLGRFGSNSYFADARFREAFHDLMHLLRERGWLRLTTLLVRGEVAAVDMGCLHNDACTLLAGGTSGAFPGVAKLINIHHMRRACEQRLQLVDFLCGDFSWKKLFHLTPRPLHLLSNVPRFAGAVAHPEHVGARAAVELGSAACV